jgi:sugar phosphate isomerase/epimerase
LTVQASDWRTPRSFADRIIPGDGTIPLATLIKATRATGYAKPWVVEIFSNEVSNSLYDDDLEAVVTRCREGMAAAWTDAQ